MPDLGYPRHWYDLPNAVDGGEARVIDSVLAGAEVKPGRSGYSIAILGRLLWSRRTSTPWQL